MPRNTDHDVIFASFRLDLQKPKCRTKTIYDYNNADVDGLINHIKCYNFDRAVFSQPIILQADIFDKILIDAFALFVPTKTVTIRPNDQPWSNTYTRLLLRRKNRNYLIYKKINSNYSNLSKQTNASPEILTRCLAKKNKAHSKARDAANASNSANRRTKIAFFNTVNCTMNNHSISAKKKFSILLKLMKNNKYCGISPLNENDETVNDPKTKSEIFNDFFASKSNLNGLNDVPPNLEKDDNIPKLANLNTSPIEVSKLIRNLKKSHISPCGISGKFLQLISKEISYSLSRLFNNLFEVGLFPDNWKIAHVTPIYKRSGSKNCKSNYRPISILPSLSKVCESVIHERLLSHCIDNDIISERQAAYLKEDSIIKQVLYIVLQIR